MHTYRLADDFTDTPAEQALLASIARTPSLYWELLDLLTPDVFTKEAETWRTTALAIEVEQSPTVPADWLPAHDPQAVAHRLADLYQRRLLAAAQERIAQALFNDDVPATDIATLLEEEALQVQAALRATATGTLQWTSDLLPQVLADAAGRREQREETGMPVQGVLTGITRLDLLLNGLNDGLLHLLAGPPGMGKTTLAWQIAVHAAQTMPVVYVTFENAPRNLALKGLCT
ncbi:MAG: DnaB-like helicase C-terminal domain-containing protein, partial [Candidatus Tectomicrobia bacterium]